MIKRRFYRQDHADKNDASDSSSSSSDSDAIEEEKEEEKRGKPSSPSPGSGYESEDSSANEVNCDSSGLLLNEDEDRPEKGRQNLEYSWRTSEVPVETVEQKHSNAEAKALYAKDSSESDSAECVLKYQSVFKCRLCPRIVCLTEDTLKAHLKSKRHARSKKLLGEGRLKLMLNSDGEIEEDQETHAERHSRTMALTQDLPNLKKKNKGRQRQRLRSRNKRLRPGKQSVKNPMKKRRKTED